MSNAKIQAYNNNRAFRKTYTNKIKKKAQKGWTVGRVAKAALDTALFVKGLVNAEFKNVDTNSFVTAVAGGSVILLNGTTQGDGQTNREGSSFKMTSLYLRYSTTANATASYNTYRVMLVMDRQSNGVAPGVTDILATNTMDSPRNLDYVKRFKVLYDQVNNVGLNAKPQDFYSFKLKLQTHVQCFQSSNTGTVSDITTNGLFLVILSDQATNGPSVNYYHRLRFVDN